MSISPYIALVRLRHAEICTYEPPIWPHGHFAHPKEEQ